MSDQIPVSEVLEGETTPSWSLLSPPWCDGAMKTAAAYFLGQAGLGRQDWVFAATAGTVPVAAPSSGRKAGEMSGPLPEVRLTRRGGRAGSGRGPLPLPPMPAWDDAVAAIAGDPRPDRPVPRGASRPIGTNVALVLIRADLDAPSAADEAGAAAHALTLAALNAEAAALVGLQERQKLSSQALSFAGQREQGVLSLFR